MLPLVTTILVTKGKGNPATYLYLQLKETTSELFFCFYTIPLMFNNKPGNCDYQHFIRLLG